MKSNVTFVKRFGNASNLYCRQLRYFLIHKLEDEMNTNKKWTKSISVVLLVAIASFATAGLVLANHDTPAMGVEVSSRLIFEQYNAVLAHMEEDLNTALFTSLSTADTSSRARFDQYSWAIDEMIRASEAASVITPASDADNSMLRWEQYFEYAR